MGWNFPRILDILYDLTSVFFRILKPHNMKVTGYLGLQSVSLSPVEAAGLQQPLAGQERPRCYSNMAGTENKQKLVGEERKFLKVWSILFKTLCRALLRKKSVIAVSPKACRMSTACGTTRWKLMLSTFLQKIIVMD